MGNTLISNEAYQKLVNLMESFYLQGFEDAANCPETKGILMDSIREDIRIQLDIAGIENYDTPPNLNSLEYVLVSTSYNANETYIFKANADGEVTNWGDLGGLAERWGDEDWANSNLAMETVFGDDAKDFKIVKTMWGKGPQYLYQRVKS